jgi:hypothetical protein
MTDSDRRRLLKKGTIAALGAIAGAAAPMMATEVAAAAVDCPSPPYPEILAQVIAKAWQDGAFRENLLTFGEAAIKPEWKGDRDYSRAQKTLGLYGVHLASPVVLTEAQYRAGYTKVDNEIVFVMPNSDRVFDQKYTEATARVVMSVVACGI